MFNHPTHPVNWRDMQPADELRYMTGYLAFLHPPAINPNVVRCTPQVNNATSGQQQVIEHPMKDDIHQREQMRQKRAQSEHEEAVKGDIDWVKSGGILRDRTGKRDFERTNIIRKELELQELEIKVLERWNAYEHRWNMILASRGPLTFSAIPWPVADLPAHVSDLTIRSIAHFVIAPLRVAGSTVARRHRIRQLILRYHPDKVSSVISRTVNDDKVAVEEGVIVVLTCLKYLHDEEKAMEPPP
jgi:hypothetical protein